MKNSPLYQSVIEYVDQSFGRHNPHFESTVFWLEKFLPNCGEAEKIAAYAHDIERAFRDPSKKEPNDYKDENYLRMHMEGGAEIMRKFLTEKGASPEVIECVEHLISRHEVGGDKAQNALMDADSVSFFETNAERFIKNKLPKVGYARIKPKFEWMYNRIHSDAAKKEAQKNYEYWMSELEKAK